MSLKPHLACDIDLDKARFPLIAMPKIDGVRALHITGAFTGRSLKAFKNKWVTERYNDTPWCDGELALGDWTHPRLCSLTTGFVNRIKPKPDAPTQDDSLSWWVFDYVAPDAIALPYYRRLELANAVSGHGIKHVPFTIVKTVEEALAYDEKCLDDGFEGSIFRDPEALHKSGRASVTTNAYLRLKQFVDFEGIVTEIVEAMENQNVATVNELGRSERSSHKENKVPKGMLGGLKKLALADVKDPVTGRVLIEKDQVVDVGPGNMPHPERVHYFLHPEELLGKVVKSKFFPRGHKDKPRFPTFVSIRTEEDIS